MLISLQHDKPVINPGPYYGQVVLEFARYKNWGEELVRGMHLMDHKPWRGGYLFRVSLHEPTIYTVPTLCSDKMRRDNYTLCLMQGKDHNGWALEIGQTKTIVTLVLDCFRQELKSPTQMDTMTLWDHLDEEN